MCRFSASCTDLRKVIIAAQQQLLCPHGRRRLRELKDNSVTAPDMCGLRRFAHGRTNHDVGGGGQAQADRGASQATTGLGRRRWGSDGECRATRSQCRRRRVAGGHCRQPMYYCTAVVIQAPSLWNWDVVVRGIARFIFDISGSQDC